MKFRVFTQKHWKMILLAMIMVLVAGRIIYVNIRYPQTKREYYTMDDTVLFTSFLVKLNGIYTYDQQAFSDYAAKNIEGFDADAFLNSRDYEYYVYIVDLTVANADTVQRCYEYAARAILEIGTVSNGSYPYLNQLMNDGDALSITLEPGESRHLRAAYVIVNNDSVDDKQFAKLQDQPCEYSLKSYERLVTFRCRTQKES